MAIYTIKVINNSRFPRSYVAFMPPPPAIGGFANAWASFDNVSVGGFDSVEYAPEVGSASAPSFIVAESDGSPGQISDPASAPHTATIDFAGQPQTAIVTQNADGAFSVAYS